MAHMWLQECLEVMADGQVPNWKEALGSWRTCGSRGASRSWRMGSSRSGRRRACVAKEAPAAGRSGVLTGARSDLRSRVEACEP